MNWIVFQGLWLVPVEEPRILKAKSTFKSSSFSTKWNNVDLLSIIPVVVKQPPSIQANCIWYSVAMCQCGPIVDLATFPSCVAHNQALQSLKPVSNCDNTWPITSILTYMKLSMSSVVFFFAVCFDCCSSCHAHPQDVHSCVACAASKWGSAKLCHSPCFYLNSSFPLDLTIFRFSSCVAFCRITCKSAQCFVSVCWARWHKNANSIHFLTFPTPSTWSDC